MNTEKSIFFTNKVMAEKRAKVRDSEVYEVNARIKGRWVYVVAKNYNKATTIIDKTSLKFDGE